MRNVCPLNEDELKHSHPVMIFLNKNLKNFNRKENYASHIILDVPRNQGRHVSVCSKFKYLSILCYLNNSHKKGNIFYNHPTSNFGTRITPLSENTSLQEEYKAIWAEL